MKESVEALVVLTIITFPLSLIVGLIISFLAYSNIETKAKAGELFFKSIFGGFIGGLVGGGIGGYLASESASTADGLFGGLSAISEVINYFQIFAPCWIFSTFGGAALAIKLLNKSNN